MASSALGAAMPVAGAVGAARMAAWRVHAYGGLADLRLEAARVPALRAPDQLLVRVHASSVNPIDVAMIGGYGHRALNALRSLESLSAGAGGGAGQVELPLVAGRDFVGRVEVSGAAARLRPGARVWGVLPPHWPGAHAQYVVVRDRWAGVAPECLDDLCAGGALYAALTACAALRVGGLPPGRRHNSARVLVLGLGGVGQAALQLLVASGAHVVVGCAGAAAHTALRLGAAAALDRHAHDYDGQLQHAGPYDVILDCAGLGGGEAGARRWRFSRYVTLTSPLLRHTDARGLLGAATAAAELAAQCVAAARAAPHTHTGESGAGGGAGGGWVPPHVRWAYFMPSADDIELLRRLAERQQFAVSVQRAWGWRSGGDAYAALAAGHARGKLLLDFTDDTQAPPTPTPAPAHHAAGNTP